MAVEGRRAMWGPPTMDFRFLNHLLPPFGLSSNSASQPQPISSPEPSPQNQFLFLLTRSFLSILPSNLLPKPRPPRSPNPSSTRPSEAGCSLPLFRPYVAKVPWHGGVRAFLSQLFPRYGHYCGPNWSSGKAGGTMLWDQRPIDWLDFCCYCHDIGYDTHDQAKLLKADLALLECLERPRMATKGGAHLALLYRSMCITGLRNILITYRMQLLRLQAGPSVPELLGNLVSRGNTFRQNSE